MRVGIVGTGGMGNVHARHYARLQHVQLIAYDPDSGKLGAFCETHGAVPVHSFDELIRESDAVDLCTPTDLHKSQALEVLRAGRPVLVEKPMASSVVECKELCDAATKANVLLMPAQVVRYFPEFRRARELVQAGRIGQPAAARTRRGGKAPGTEGSWFRDFKRSGGILLDLAVHDFDWLRWTLGEVAEVYAASVGDRWPQSGADYALTTLRFDSGAIAHVESTWMDPAGGRVTFEICGSEGMLEYDSRLTQTVRTTTEKSQIVEAPLALEDDPYFQQLSAFVNSIETGSPAPVTAYDGLMAVSIACAAIKSVETGRPVAPERP